MSEVRNLNIDVRCREIEASVRVSEAGCQKSEIRFWTSNYPETRNLSMDVRCSDLRRLSMDGGKTREYLSWYSSVINLSH